MQGLKDWLLEGIRQTNDRSYRSLNRESTVTEEERRVILRRQQVRLRWLVLRENMLTVLLAHNPYVGYVQSCPRTQSCPINRRTIGKGATRKPPPR